MDDEDLAIAAAAIQAGGVVAYPTEAVFGLGCNPRDEAAVMQILRLKGRRVEQGVLLIAASYEQLSPYVEDLPTDAAARVFATWPGPQTWIFPARPDAPAWIRGTHEGVGVRVTAHPVAAALCRAAGDALVSTSANRHGEPPARSAREVQEAFGDDLEYVLDAPCGGLPHPTPIRDALTGAVIRQG